MKNFSYRARAHTGSLLAAERGRSRPKAWRCLPASERGSGYPTVERGQATPQQRRAQEKRKGKGGKTTNVLPTGTNEFL